MVLEMTGVSDLGVALARWVYRVVRLVSDDLAFNEKALRRGGPLCPPVRFDMWLVDGFVCV